MKVAVVGSSGYISDFLIKRLEKESNIVRILKIDRTDEADIYLDLQCAQDFRYEELAEIDYVIFTAAVSGPDQCAADFDFCWTVNVTGTKYFIEKALEYHCKILFFSSDAVFGDIPGYIYTEQSETKAVTPYGRMKKAVEDEFKNNSSFKAIRLSYVASAKDKYVTYCLNCMKRGETAEVFHPFYRNCIAVSDVVDVVIWFLNHWQEYSPFVLNVAGKELVSRVRIADEINRNFDNKLDYKVVRPQAGFYDNRPSITQMESIYNEQYQILEDNSFSEKIRKELGEYER